MNALDALKIQPVYTRLVSAPIQTQHLIKAPAHAFIAQLAVKEKYRSVNATAAQVVVLFALFTASYMT